MKTYVYHACRRQDIGNTCKGYIGVSVNPKRRESTHRRGNINNPHFRAALELYSDVIFSVIFEGTEEECYTLENKLRPSMNIGWNIAIGGGKAPSVDNTGRVHSKEAREKQAKAKIGNCNVGSGENHHFYGKTGKQGIRYGVRGKLHPLYLGEWVTPDGSFESMAAVATYYNIAKSTVHYRCKKSTNWRNKGWFFKEK